MQQGNTAVATNACTGEPCDLYRFFDAADQLLYVGISKELPTRWRDHGKVKPWWPSVVRATIEHHDSREEAEAAEVQAIRTEQPLWNIKDAPKPSIQAAPTSRPALADTDAPKREMTPAEAASALRVSPATIRRWEARGVLRPSRRLPGSRHRRYSGAEVEALRQLAQDPDAFARVVGGAS